MERIKQALTACESALSCGLVDLLLLRHGIAVDRHQGVDHPDRCLTPLGLERTFACAAVCASSDSAPIACTAVLIAERMKRLSWP